MTDDVRSLAIIPRSITECTALAEILAKSELLPKALRGKVPDVMMTIMAGQEMGLSPMASLRSFHVIEGKPVMGADGMVAIVLGSGKAQYFDRIEESDTSVTYETLRIGSKVPRRCTWTLEMAKKAGVHLKDNWRAYPRAMLAARAKSELARDVYADVLAGCYTQDEIETSGRQSAPANHAPAAVDAEVIDAEYTDVPLLSDMLAKIDSASSIENLKALAKDISKLKLVGADKQAASDRYRDRMAVLKSQPAEAQPAEIVA